MAINSTLKGIYQNAIDNKFGYDLTSLTHYGLVGIGTSNPEKYSSCLSFAKECQTIALNDCQSYIVKNGIGENHEFIDAPLAALFLSNHKMKIFLTQYPKDGYSMVYINNNESTDILSILGTASQLMCGYKSFTDIMNSYRASNDKGDPNINARGFNRGDYLNELRGYFSKTDPQSITDYYITQYISGGGDPNPGYIGFAKIYHVDESQYDYVIAKVDLGASFKDYSQISGSKPTLESNKYAFTLNNNIKNFQELYEYIIKDGNILMPGIYGCDEKQYLCQWKGQGNVGLYNGQYKKSNAYGINMSDNVKIKHLQDSLIKLCRTNKDNIINIFTSSAHKIQKLLYNSKEKDVIPVINESEEIFSQYIDGRADFISTRYDKICNFLNESSIDNNNEPCINCESIRYASYEWSHPDFFYNYAVAGMAAAIGVVTLYGIYQYIHQPVDAHVHVD